MKTAFLVLGRECNNRCEFCFNRWSEPDKSSSALDPAALEAYLNDLAALGFTHLLLTGGEPLIHSRIDAIIDLIQQKGFYADLITNGRLLDRKRAEQLAVKLPGMVIWSLNDIHNQVPEPGRFLSETKRKIAELSEVLSGRISIIFVFTRPTIDLIREVTEICINAGVGLLLQPAFLPPESADYQRLSPMALAENEWSDLIKALKPWADHYGAGSFIRLLDGIYRHTDIKPEFCFMGQKACVVEADGTVHPCFHRRDLPAGKLGVGQVKRIGQALAQAHDQLHRADCFGLHCSSLFIY